MFLALGELLLSCNWAVVADILLVGVGVRAEGWSWGVERGQLGSVLLRARLLLSGPEVRWGFRDHGVRDRSASSYLGPGSSLTLSNVSSGHHSCVVGKHIGGSERAGAWTRVTQPTEALSQGWDLGFLTPGLFLCPCFLTAILLSKWSPWPLHWVCSQGCWTLGAPSPGGFVPPQLPYHGLQGSGYNEA